MKVKVEKISGCEVKLNFVLEETEFDSALDEAFVKKVSNLEVKGFRKGKVPREIYNAKFGEESLYDEAMNIAINKAYEEALTKHKFEIVSSPQLDVKYETIGKGKKLEFSVQFEVTPDVELGQYKGLEIEKEKVEVTDEDVNKYINDKLEASAELEVVENGKLEKGNTAVFDFEGFVDGTAFEGGKAENYELVIGSGQFIPGFEEQMIGMTCEEEKEIQVKFPEDYHAENLKGKEATFKVKLHEIKKRVLPELNDDFVKDQEIEKVTNVEEYKKYVYDVLVEEKKSASENKFVNDVLKLAVDNAKLEVPHGLVEEEINRMFSQVEHQAKTYNIPVEQFLGFYGIKDVESYKKMLEPNAFNAVKERAVFLKIAEVEKIKLTSKEYDAEYKIIASEYNKPLEEVKNVYAKEVIAPYLKIRKVIDLIKETAIVK